MKRLILDPWSLALALWLGLAWHGGLHAAQVLAALAVIALLWGTAPRRFQMSDRFLLAFLALLVWQLLASVQAQVSVNQVAWLAALAILAQALRRQERPRAVALAWAVGLAVLGALALFGRSAWVLRQDPGKAWAGTELVAVATHWFFPNQNLLVVGVFVPGILLALAWIYGRTDRDGRGGLGWAGWTAWAVISAGIAYAGSRGGLLALAGGGLWWLGRAWRQDGFSRRLAVVALLLAMSLGVSWRSPLAGLQRRAEANAAPRGADSFRYQRLKFWKASLLASAQRPLFGWGQGAFAEAILRQDVGGELSERNPIARYRLKLTHAHNELLEMAVELGWPLALTLASLLAAFFWMRWHTRDPDPSAWALEAFLAGLAIHAMVDMPLRPAFMQLNVALCIAWLWPKRQADEEDDGDDGSAASTAVVLALALMLGTGAWMRVRLKGADERTPYRAWRVATVLQPLDVSLALQAARAEKLQPAPWTNYFGREDKDWYFFSAHPSPQTPRLSLIQRYLQMRPYDAEGWLELAKEAQLRRIHPLAETALDRALSLEPNFVDAWALRLEIATANKDKAAAAKADAELTRIHTLVIPADQARDPWGLRLLNRPMPHSAVQEPL